MITKIGFTGTRSGMTPEQRLGFDNIIAGFLEDGHIEFHHGDCVGADADAHDFIFGLENQEIHIHPPLDDSLQARCKGYSVYHEPQTYLKRNRDIVNSVSCMIACPPTDEERKNGGTWYTVNYCNKANTQVHIIYPDGRVEYRANEPIENRTV